MRKTGEESVESSSLASALEEAEAGEPAGPGAAVGAAAGVGLAPPSPVVDAPAGPAVVDTPPVPPAVVVVVVVVAVGTTQVRALVPQVASAPTPPVAHEHAGRSATRAYASALLPPAPSSNRTQREMSKFGERPPRLTTVQPAWSGTTIGVHVSSIMHVFQLNVRPFLCDFCGVSHGTDCPLCRTTRASGSAFSNQNHMSLPASLATPSGWRE